jgi:nucleoid DNA-binding protein
MAIKVNARETELKIGKKPGYYYVMTPELYLALTQKKVIKEAALRSGVSQGAMQACWDAAGEVIKAWATEGHSVAIPGLGTIRFAVRSQAVANVEKVGVDLIKSKRIVFTPSVDIKRELAETSINITCIDRNGNIVKRITTDGGEVEDGEDENENGNQNSNPQSGSNGSNENQNGGSQSGSGENQSGGSQSGSSQSGSQNSGSGDSSGKPTISGIANFQTSTTVTITGPEGATIRYTSDGSTPTATSGEVYTEPFTLNDSATIKAVAVVDGVASEVTTRVFTKSSGD